MIKINLIKIIILCTFLLFSFDNKKQSQNRNPNNSIAGVVLTFDDAFVNEWLDANKILSKYSWKATFCVSKINTLNVSEISKLLELQDKGHEIAAHGLNHLDAVKFVTKNGIDDYVNQEITPMLDLMDFYSLKVSSFAYPFGFRNSKTDEALLNEFKILRGLTYGAGAPSLQNCFFNNTKLVYGIEIDENHPKFNFTYLLKLLSYAKKNNKILILVGHKPQVKITGDYQTKLETLNLICNYVKQNNMKFYCLSELNNYKFDIISLQ